jgi:hypothetical protein
MPATCEIEAALFVALGAFNPKIFQPAWFGANKLIRKEESDNAKIAVITHDICAFTAGWLTVQVTQQRFEAQTPDPGHFIALRDLVIATFTLLEHTPFDKVGLNRLAHFRMSSEERWHALGHLLVPKDPWKSVMSEPKTQGVVVQGTREGRASKTFSVRLEPSVRVKHGVFVETNEHFEESGEDAARHLLKTVNATWLESMQHGRAVAEKLVQLVDVVA